MTDSADNFAMTASSDKNVPGQTVYMYTVNLAGYLDNIIVINRFVDPHES